MRFMKTNYCAIVFFIFFISACKKNGGPSNTWKLDGTLYSGEYTEYILNTYNSSFTNHYYLEGENLTNHQFMSVILPNTTGTPASGIVDILPMDTLNPPSGQQITFSVGYTESGTQTIYIPDGNSADKAEIFMYNGNVCCRAAGVHVHRKDNVNVHSILDFDLMETTH